MEASLKEARDSVSLIMYNAVRERYPEAYKWISTAEENGWCKALNDTSSMYITGSDGILMDIFPYSMYSEESALSYTFCVPVPEGKHIVYPFRAVEESPALREALDAEGKKILVLISRINDVGRLVDSVRTTKQLLKLITSVKGILNGYSDASVNN